MPKVYNGFKIDLWTHLSNDGLIYDSKALQQVTCKIITCKKLLLFVVLCRLQQQISVNVLFRA